MKLRILFVSGTAVGGSARSTSELAAALAGRGHTVGVLWGTEAEGRLRHAHKRAVNLHVKLGSSPLAGPVATAAATLGRRPAERATAGPVRAWDATLPENAYPAVRRALRPDVVVASSIDRMAWRRLRTLLAADAVPSVLYLREHAALGHLAVSNAPPDLLVANARALADDAATLGFPALTIPSVVTLDRIRVHSTRERILLVNPKPMFGVDVALDLARARPDVAFTLQESWPLSPEDKIALGRLVSDLPNVEVRAPVPDPGAIYRDARLLLSPYRASGRPRVVLEAHTNGIPVLGSDAPALREAIGPAGATLDVDAPPAAWLAALSELIDDPVRYERYCAIAREHSRRPEVDPDVITGCFEQALTDLVTTGRWSPQSR